MEYEGGKQAKADASPHGATHRFIRPPSYFECRRIVARLLRMQNLIRHKMPWEADLAQPDSRLPDKSDPRARDRVIDREINRLIPLVLNNLDYALIQTEVVSKELDQRIDNGRVLDRHVDVRQNVFEDFAEMGADLTAYRIQMEALERGIGVYSAWKERAFWQLFSPITWLAWIIGMPVRILERAGVSMEDATSKGVQTVAWVLRLTMLAVLAFLAAKAGFSVPWEKLASLLK